MPKMAREFRDVDPKELRLPGSRSRGADPVKLHDQIRQFGNSMVGMPPLWVYEAADGVLVVYNGVTRSDACGQAFARNPRSGRGDRQAASWTRRQGRP
jgi:hypothetical protein